LDPLKFFKNLLNAKDKTLGVWRREMANEF
jgi:hypothetical protein